MSEPYALKYPVNDETLECLNRLSRNHIQPKADYRAIGGVDEIEDWIAALKSGKKIVNPMSPREEVKEIYYSFPPHSHEWSIADRLIRAIAKKHPDVKGWLKDGDNDA